MPMASILEGLTIRLVCPQSSQTTNSQLFMGARTQIFKVDAALAWGSFRGPELDTNDSKQHAGIVAGTRCPCQNHREHFCRLEHKKQNLYFLV